jgi:hypothetical protein
MRTQGVGCGFAQSFAARSDTGGLQPVTVEGREFQRDDIEPLNRLLIQACLKYEGVYIVFPNINTSADIVALIQSLCMTEVWRCNEIIADPPLTDNAFLIGLRWFLPDKQHMNYVLGFARLEQMPRTRRAPHTTLLFRTGPVGPVPGIAFSEGANPKSDDRHTMQPPIPVHLADMPHLRRTDKQVADLWRYTTKLKRKELAGDAYARAAKAKVTFCLPASARDTLANVIAETAPLESTSTIS